jgi:hypothetical protein
MEDNRPGDSLGRWGLAFATAGVAIAFVVLIFIPLLIWFPFWYLTRGMPPVAGD